MYSVLVRLILVAALLELGVQNVLSLVKDPKHLDAKTKSILSIDWKPISVFPKDAKRFK